MSKKNITFHTHYILKLLLITKQTSSYLRRNIIPRDVVILYSDKLIGPVKAILLTKPLTFQSTLSKY